MCAYDEDRGLGTVAGDGVEPEVESGVLVSEARVPHQKVDGSAGEEELQQAPAGVHGSKRVSNGT